VSGNVDITIYQLLKSQIGKSYDVIMLKKQIFDNSIFKILHDGYLEQLSDWGQLIELAYLEHSRRVLKQQFPDAYKSVTNINMTTNMLRSFLVKKLNMDREWINLSFKEKEHAVYMLKFRDSLRLRGNSKIKKHKTEIRDLFSKDNFDDLTRIFPVILCNPETACT